MKIRIMRLEFNDFLILMYYSQINLNNFLYKSQNRNSIILIPNNYLIIFMSNNVEEAE